MPPGWRSGCLCGSARPTPAGRRSACGRGHDARRGVSAHGRRRQSPRRRPTAESRGADRGLP
eukprot:6745241-Heterocapsa_arctica.AAC.1